MYHFHCHFHFHFHAKRKYPPPRFSAHSAGRFLLLLPLTVFFWLRRSGIFLVLSFLWSRARAKIRKILFCLLFPRFLFLFFFYLFSFFFKHQISGFQFQCRFKVAACYLVGGKWAGYVTRRATMKTGQRQEAEKITEIPPLWPHRKLWLFKDPNSFDLQRKIPGFSYSRYWNKSQSKLNINKYIIKKRKNDIDDGLDYKIPVFQLKIVRGRWRYECSNSAVSEIAHFI